jgi:hypothetical protein
VLPPPPPPPSARTGDSGAGAIDLSPLAQQVLTAVGLGLAGSCILAAALLVRRRAALQRRYGAAPSVRGAAGQPAEPPGADAESVAAEARRTAREMAMFALCCGIVGLFVGVLYLLASRRMERVHSERRRRRHQVQLHLRAQPAGVQVPPMATPRQHTADSATGAAVLADPQQLVADGVPLAAVPPRSGNGGGAGRGLLSIRVADPTGVPLGAGSEPVKAAADAWPPFASPHAHGGSGYDARPML